MLFRLMGYAGDTGNGLQRIAAYGGFTGEHHRRGAIQHRVGDVADLRFGWQRVLYHAVQQFRRYNGGFARMGGG